VRIGASLFLIALGAILKFAITRQRTHGFDIGAIGVILMVVGALGLAISLLWLATRPRHRIVTAPRVPRRRRTVVTEEPIDRPPY
jgi:hypothetical protein